MIFDCIKELFMLVIALCTACFSKAKINKKPLAPYFKIWLPASNTLAPALCIRFSKLYSKLNLVVYVCHSLVA